VLPPWGEHGAEQKGGVMPGGLLPAAALRWGVAAAVVVCAATAQAGPPEARIAVAAVHAPDAHGALRGPLRDALEQALERADGVRLAPNASAELLVRAALTSLERQKDGSVRCRVSLTMEDRRTGALRMMLQGGASARGSQAVRLAMEGALMSALRPLGRPLLAAR
jgi:hypothetical protein